MSEISHRDLTGPIDGLLVGTRDPSWAIEALGYAPALEHEVESRFTISNGVIGSRASLEAPTPASRPRTYVAGFFDAASEDRVTSSLTAIADWLRLAISVDGQGLSLMNFPDAYLARRLDLRHGLLFTEWQFRLETGKDVHFTGLRFASLANRRLAAQVASLRISDSALVDLRAKINVLSEPVTRPWPGCLTWSSAKGNRHVAVVSDSQLQLGGRRLSGSAWDNDENSRSWTWTASPGDSIVFSKIVSFAVTDGPNGPSCEQASAALKRARRAGLRRLLKSHTRAWEKQWTVSDIVLEGDDAAQTALRFAIYHLISSANPGDDRSSIGARGLTGDAYMGHVFWDTEIFMLPFYLYTWPEAARSLLMYRYHTLPSARAKARSLGYQGALYSWESTDTGEDATPPFALRPDGLVVTVVNARQEQHISADIAYAVWQYWEATHDVPFLLGAGAEIVLETARFWASRAVAEGDGFYHIRGVVGPDEYHENVDDNAYTNTMAQWNLERGLELAEMLSNQWPHRWSSIQNDLDIRQDELQYWRDVASKLALSVDPCSGIIQQFDGFFELEQIDLKTYEGRTAPMDVILGRERTQRSQVIKQADVLMLAALLWDRISPQSLEANFDYYAPLCAHGSSLSPAIHALVAAKLGKTEVALRYFEQASAIDQADSMGNVAGGVHMGALGGLCQAVVFGFAGVSWGSNAVLINPHLPDRWQALSFRLRWRGSQLRVCLRQKPLTINVAVERGRSTIFKIGSFARKVARGQSWTCIYNASISAWEEDNG